MRNERQLDIMVELLGIFSDLRKSSVFMMSADEDIMRYIRHALKCQQQRIDDLRTQLESSYGKAAD